MVFVYFLYGYRNAFGNNSDEQSNCGLRVHRPVQTLRALRRLRKNAKYCKPTNYFSVNWDTKVKFIEKAFANGYACHTLKGNYVPNDFSVEVTLGDVRAVRLFRLTEISNFSDNSTLAEVRHSGGNPYAGFVILEYYGRDFRFMDTGIRNLTISENYYFGSVFSLNWVLKAEGANVVPTRIQGYGFEYLDQSQQDLLRKVPVEKLHTF